MRGGGRDIHGHLLCGCRAVAMWLCVCASGVTHTHMCMFAGLCMCVCTHLGMCLCVGPRMCMGICKCTPMPVGGYLWCA